MSELTWCGLPVVSSHLLAPQPVLRIRDDVPCSEPVRSEVNAYLLRTFGARHTILKMEDRIYAHPDVVAQLRALRVHEYFPPPVLFDWEMTKRLRTI